MIDLWLNAIDDSKLIGVVLVDFKKAFDLVEHQILLNKLEIYGIKGEALQWFNTFLANRKQTQVAINNSKSDFKHISCSVPQGSILGPLLFYFLSMIYLYAPTIFSLIYMRMAQLYMMYRIPLKRMRKTFSLL